MTQPEPVATPPEGALLDLGVPRGVQQVFETRGIAVRHVCDLDMTSATDAEIVAHARHERLLVVTTDTGCANVVARSGEHAPSVITLRLDDPRLEEQVGALEGLLSKVTLTELASCMITLERERYRRRELPGLPGLG